jgi:hypothetical protein
MNAGARPRPHRQRAPFPFSRTSNKDHFGIGGDVCGRHSVLHRNCQRPSVAGRNGGVLLPFCQRGRTVRHNIGHQHPARGQTLRPHTVKHCHPIHLIPRAPRGPTRESVIIQRKRHPRPELRFFHCGRTDQPTDTPLILSAPIVDDCTAIIGRHHHQFSLRVARHYLRPMQAFRSVERTHKNWRQDSDLNRGPSGYEPDELPDCSILRPISYHGRKFCPLKIPKGNNRGRRRRDTPPTRRARGGRGRTPEPGRFRLLRPRAARRPPGCRRTWHAPGCLHMSSTKERRRG